MSVKVVVPCRFSYLHCWEAVKINGGEPKYSVSAIIPKSDKATIKKIYRPPISFIRYLTPPPAIAAKTPAQPKSSHTFRSFNTRFTE